MTSGTKRGNSVRKTSKSSNTRRKTASSSRKAPSRKEEVDYSIRSEIVVIATIAFTIFLFLCNFGICGSFGNAISKVLFGLFGITAYIAPIVALSAVVIGIANFGSNAAVRKISSGLVLFVIIGMLSELIIGRPQKAEAYSLVSIYTAASTERNGGGVLAGSIAYLFFRYLSLVGTILIILVAGIVSLVIFTQHSFVGGIQRGSRRLIERTRQDAENYRDYAERRREKMQQRRERLEEEKRLAIEQKEDEKILRMEKKVSGVMIDTALEKDEEPAPAIEAIDNLPEESKKIFIPEEDISDDIHEITINREIETDVEPDGQRVMRTEPVIHGMHFDEPEDDPSQNVQEEISYIDWQKTRDKNVVEISSYNSDDFREKDNIYHLSDARQKMNEDDYSEDNLRGDNSEEYNSKEADYREDYHEDDVTEEETPVISNGTDTSLNRLLARVSEAEDSDEEILPDVPVHAENIGNGMNGDYVIHAQDHLSMSRDASTQIDSSSKGSSTISLGPGPHTTSPGMEKQIEEHKKTISKKYVFPPVSLLEKGVKNKNVDTERTLKETALKLQDIIKSFGVNVNVTDISQGPSVTRFELQPEAGVRVNKIVNLADDIKMNLAARDIRIEAPIPGKAAVGIEVPNKENQMVALRDLFESAEFNEFDSKLAFAVGKDIAGKTVVADIAKMPHLLIAGATGSGKSVCINTIIMSLIYKATPEEVQMIMIDPKIVELSIYNGIPHLMIPVVTDPKKAAAALNWAVAEMTNRYKKFAEAGVRDLKGYNRLAKEDPSSDKTVLPQIVVIVDELADLMMVSANEVEEAICRLTQLARAAGIHLIIATQRPSVDVITGLIKANMPSRIAFAVSSGVDSRTILDINGAEKLLGKGDMLFYPQGYTKPVRVQGAFVSDKEVQQVTDFLREQKIESSYAEEVESQIVNMQGSSQTSGGSIDSDSGRDEYFVQAGNIIIEKDRASIGFLQRVFKIGFNRAARIMDQLCEAGVVGDEEGTKARKVLMTKAQFDEYVNGQTAV
ncbi:FtsK/SpoIIIE family DNA translocase [Butyrivibrio sp. YAB3001]|uniref:FtsK/SpoIIIE family DNA translocase n=1 Tax=Butyrivibrio sp. YAB3001 TaxID=1520812 RepID=UPI0008F628DD|nr:DNA translocase FtsK [Butyrivibrio sp. YAB3001]SFD02452.1 DNA segregation ATPase FtsK/SpoIIIE, S-DNA-T family [Butyrivibrio sp. YAB3001]